MPWTAPQVHRNKTPYVAGERQMLEAWLDFHRQTLLIKCGGLTGEQLRLRAAPPSTMSLLGLVRHMAEVERGWFRRRVAGEDVGFLYSSEADPDGEFDHVDTADPDKDFATYLGEIDLARKAAAGHDLDETFHHSHRDAQMSVRWVYVHMIEELLTNAIACFQEALELLAVQGNRYKAAEASGHLAEAYLATGDLAKARAALSDTLAILDGLHHPYAGVIRDKLRMIPV